MYVSMYVEGLTFSFSFIHENFAPVLHCGLLTKGCQTECYEAVCIYKFSMFGDVD